MLFFFFTLIISQNYNIYIGKDSHVQEQPYQGLCKIQLDNDPKKFVFQLIVLILQ
jgi:hypothetical protein